MKGKVCKRIHEIIHDEAHPQVFAFGMIPNEIEQVNPSILLESLDHVCIAPGEVSYA